MESTEWHGSKAVMAQVKDVHIRQGYVRQLVQVTISQIYVDQHYVLR